MFLMKWWKAVVSWFRPNGNTLPSPTGPHVWQSVPKPPSPPPRPPPPPPPEPPRPAAYGLGSAQEQAVDEVIKNSIAEPARPDAPSAIAGVDQVEQGDSANDRRSTREAESPPNRQQRRRTAALERERRKHDKFVTPGGESRPERPPTKGPRPKVMRSKTEEGENEDVVEFEMEEKKFEGWENLPYHKTEFYGEFNFRDTILDQLDRYWVYLSRMKTHDKDAFEFYKQIGATIVPHAGLFFIHCRSRRSIRDDKFTAEEIEDLRKETHLPTWFNLKRPGFGCMVFGAYPEAEKHELEESKKGKLEGWSLWIPKFMYFVKYKKPPPEIQPTHGDGDVYKMVVWWDRPHDPKYAKHHGVPTEYAVFCSKDGQHIDVLKVIDTEFVQVRHKRNGAHQHRGKTFSFPHRHWHIPSELEKWAKQFGLDPQLHLAHMFCTAVRRMENQQFSMVRIAVHKGDLTAVFGVNIKRMSYFFQDRDLAFTIKGARRKVFHIVKAHERHYKDGRIVPVRLHFRGEKEFDWAGYHVKVTVPGLDHFLFSEISTGVEDEYWQDPKEKYLFEGECAKLLVDKMNAGAGGHKR